MSENASATTPREELERQIVSYGEPKNEREWWACNEIHRLRDALADEAEADKREWRCFHCDEVFKDQNAAADHFGTQIDGLANEVACKLNATDGLLVKMLREAQEELREYHQEDNESYRQFYALGADHAAALRRAEEQGYGRGLKDGIADVRARAEGRRQMRAAEAVRQFVLDWHNISQDEFIAKYRNYPQNNNHAFSDYAYRLANLSDHPETKAKEERE